MRLLRILLISAMANGPVVARHLITFDQDVHPILEKYCVSCHRTGGLAPMPFTTYEETRPWAVAIRAVVVNKKMPPWLTEAHPGLFGADGHLTSSEVDTIVRWVEAGAPEKNGQNARDRIRSFQPSRQESTP